MAPKARLYIHHGTADDIVYYPFNAELTVDNLHNEGGLTTLVRYEDHDHYSPAIWTPFMEVGGKVFTFGLLMSSCNYFKQSKLGVILVLIGTSVVYPRGGGIIFQVICSLQSGSI